MPRAVFGSPEHPVIFKSMAWMRRFGKRNMIDTPSSQDLRGHAESKSGIFAFQRSETAKTEQTLFTAM